MYKEAKRLLGVLLIAVAILLSGCRSPLGIEPGEHFQGTTNANAQDLGYILSDGEWVYYAIDDGISKAKLDGSSAQRLREGMSYSLNLVGNWIYYTNGRPSSIYRIDLEGKGRRKVIDDLADNVIVTDYGIFYRLSSYDDNWGKLYRTDLNGKNKKLIANDATRFAIKDDLIFFANGEDGHSLYRVNIDGSDCKKIVGDHAYSINVQSEYVYYVHINADDGILGMPYRIKLDGTGKTQLSAESCWNINVYGGYIYCRNQSQKGKVYRMNLDGTNNFAISDVENCSYINVIGNFVAFYGEKQYRAYSHDGRELQGFF